ncbi:MAG: VWA-like domain-containing protein [bacterium]|nr:VWA-like domain-containing protein [bacterium]
MNIHALKLHFIKTEPELAKMLLACRLIEDKTITTMGINITNTPNIFYNPSFLSGLSEGEAGACLKHELYHLLNLHLVRWQNYNPSLYNIAADLSINQYIKGLPKGCLDISQFPHLDKKRHSEYYYHELYKNAKKITISTPHLDGHRKWQESVSAEEAEQIIGDILDAMDIDLDVLPEIEKETKQKFWNRGHKNLKRQLVQKKLPKIVNWKEILRTIRNTQIIRTKHTTVYRKNKRYPHLEGSMRIKKTHTKGRRTLKRLYVAVDVSGSISDQDCFAFLKNCETLIPFVHDMTIIQCSDWIHHTEKIKENGRNLKKLQFTRHGTGGTSFVPVFDYIQKNHNSKHTEKNYLVYLTDLIGDFPKAPPENIQTVWVSNHKNITTVPFGELYFLNPAVTN